MSKTTIKSNRLISVLLCSLFLPISSCVNKLDSETLQELPYHIFNKDQ